MCRNDIFGRLAGAKQRSRSETNKRRRQIVTYYWSCQKLKRREVGRPWRTFRTRVLTGSWPNCEVRFGKVVPFYGAGKMEESEALNTWDDLLNTFGAGITGEEHNGIMRVVFSRRCDNIDQLVAAFQALGKDFVVPERMGDFLHLNVVPVNEDGESVPHELFSDFKWQTNKMGLYTFDKTAMAGVRLRQLFLQLEANFTPEILEDVPGTDQFFLHVSRRSTQQSERSEEDATEDKNGKPRAKAPLAAEKGLIWSLCLFMLLVAILVSVIGTLSTDEVETAWEEWVSKK